MIKLVPGRKLKVLDFDIEIRPLSYLGGDFTTAEITAIAASFGGKRAKVHSWFLGEDSYEEMLLGFVELYNEADMVTGHYIRKHDLLHINGALMDLRLPVLGSKLTSDTKMDLVAATGISKSQESLSDILSVATPKYHMTQYKWRQANRLLPEGIAEARKRCVGDIRQHKQMRQKLIDNGYLGAPVMWSPSK